MGVFDNGEMVFETSAPEVEPVTTDTSTAEGHAEGSQEANAPETTGEVKPESTATQEVKEIQQEEAKLLAGKYKTIGGLVNGISDAAKLTGADIDWNKLNTPEEMENCYLDLRKQISRGEIKNLAINQQPIQQQAQLSQPEPVQQYVPYQDITIEADKIITESNQALQDIVDLSDDDLSEIYIDNPVEALKVQKESLERKFEARMNLEAAKLLKTLAPVINQYREQQAEAAGTDSWGKALGNFENIVNSHGDNDAEQYAPRILEYLKKDPQTFRVIHASPSAELKSNAIMMAYRDLKLQDQLNELAKTKSEQDTRQIQDSKAGLKMTSGVGGGKLDPPNKDQELKNKIFGSANESTGIFS
jgi:hypothetical protein